MNNNNAGGEGQKTGEEDWKDDDFLSLDVTKKKDSDDDDECDSMMEESSSDNEEQGPVRQRRSRRPPWLLAQPAAKRDGAHLHPLTRLHNEIVSFCTLMEPLPSEIQQREELVERVRDIVRKHFGKKTKVEVFGSQATGLFLPTSDIDIVVTMTNDEEDVDESKGNKGKRKDGGNKGQEGDPPESYLYQAKSPLERFAKALHVEWQNELSYLEVIEGTRIPLVKFTHAGTDICIDVSFNQPSGPPAAQLMKEYLQALPPLRPLTFVLKFFLAARGLNEPYSGGVGSFMLQVSLILARYHFTLASAGCLTHSYPSFHQLMIVAFLQHRERYARQFRRPSLYNLGSLLLEFFELYGIDFNYHTTGISVRNDGYFFPKGASDRKNVFYEPTRPFLMAIESPLDPTQNVGLGSFRIQLVQRAFAHAYRVLMANITEFSSTIKKPRPDDPFAPFHHSGNSGSILATVLPATTYMTSRLVLKRRDRALSAKRKPTSSSPDSNRDQKRQKSG
jgi:non-canonical poly(A) RNA polymerase PAPD5/7